MSFLLNVESSIRETKLYITYVTTDKNIGKRGSWSEGSIESQNNQGYFQAFAAHKLAARLHCLTPHLQY